VTIHSARPGVVIGKKGADIASCASALPISRPPTSVINIVEIRKPELDATLVAESIAQQLERRVAFRRAMKRACSRRCVLAPKAFVSTARPSRRRRNRSDGMVIREGRVPLHTLRADIDYGWRPRSPRSAYCGVKVWIFKGEILEHDPMAQDKKMAEGDTSRPRRGRCLSEIEKVLRA